MIDDPARFIAAHLPGVFIGLLLVALGLAALLWQGVLRLRPMLWQRMPLPRRPQSDDAVTGGFLLLDLLAGFGLVLAALALFVEIASHTGLDKALGRFDHQLARELAAALSDDALRFFAAVTHLGDAETLTGIGIAVALLLGLRPPRWLAASWIAAVAGNGLLNRALKALFQRERPLHEHGWASETSWSFPSGHASGAMAVYGMLAYLLIRSTPPAWHLPVALSAIAVILTVGLSRIALQVHYLSDVMAGFVSAGGWLVTCIAVTEMLRARGKA